MFYQKYQAKRYILNSNPTLEDMDAYIVKENKLRIFLNEKEIGETICSPSDYFELALGYLINAGLISLYANPDDFSKEIEENKVTIRNTSLIEKDYYQKLELKDISTNNTLPASLVLDIINSLNESSEVFRLTGGVHSAGLGYLDKMLVGYEDIGRHNAVDKVLGYRFLKRLNPKDCFLVLTGRVSTEILVKVAKSKLPIIISRSAPTNEAIDLAQKLQITLIGFARNNKFNIYTHSQRIIF